MRHYIIALIVVGCCGAFGEEKAEERKFDWSKPETVEAFFNFMAAKYKWPPTITSSKAAYNAKEKPAVLGVLFEVEKAVKDDLVKATYSAANIIGQAMAQGSPLDKCGVIFKTKDEISATVLLPLDDVKKLGQESVKGAKADKAVLNKIVAGIIAKCDWKEVDAMVKKDAK